MPRLRQVKQKVEQDSKLFDSTVVKAQGSEEEPLHENEAENTLTASSSQPLKVQQKDNEEDAALALQKQLEDLKKSEEIQRTQREQAIRERDEALKRAQEREIEASASRKEAEDSQFDAVSSALAAATAEAEKAQQDIESALNLGDTKAQAEAYRRLSRAETNVARLEDGKSEIEARRKEAPKESPAASKTVDPLDKTSLPDAAKSWLRSHPDYLSDPRKNSKIQALHWDVIDEGHAPFSTAYFDSMEQHLGLREAPKRVEQEQPRTQERTNLVSAPVSREVPSGGQQRQQGGKINLTVEQQEFARIAGVTDAEYARNLKKLNEAKANGQYTGGQ